jgi:hypothetical protein
MSLLLHSDYAGPEEQRCVAAAQAVLLGGCSPAATGAPPLHGSDVGLLYFMNEKQRLLQRCAASIDLESVTPLRLVLEFMSFVVSGLIVEAERIDAAFIALKKEIAKLGLEMRTADLDLQFRWEHSGTLVDQAVAQHYKTRVVVPASRQALSIAQRDHAAAKLSEFQAIMHQRDQMTALRQRRTALLSVQRLLRGSGAEVSADAAAAHVKGAHTVHIMRKAAHRMRDIQAELAGNAVPEVQSLLDFIAHVDVGLSAAIEDLGACALSIKKTLLEQHRDGVIRRMDALDSRNKLLSSAAMRQNEQSSRSTLRRELAPPLAIAQQQRQANVVAAPKSEMDEFLRLYCSN